MTLTVGQTARGFALVEFEDRYGSKCSLQKSSLADEDAVWFGVDDAVSLTTRMHLTREQVAELLPLLHRFVDTGELR